MRCPSNRALSIYVHTVIGEVSTYDHNYDSIGLTITAPWQLLPPIDQERAIGSVGVCLTEGPRDPPQIRKIALEKAHNRE